jgi:hypothetical protein
MSTLSAFPASLDLMKQYGIVEYFKGLLGYPNYAVFAQFFLSNAGVASPL